MYIKYITVHGGGRYARKESLKSRREEVGEGRCDGVRADSVHLGLKLLVTMSATGNE